MIQIDSSLLLQILNFLILILILNFLLYKPMLSVIDKRKQRLAESEEEIKRLNKLTEEKMAAYEEKLQSTKVESLGKNKEIIKEGSDSAKKIMNDVNNEISILTEEFHGKLQRDIEVARGFLSKQAESFSFELSEKILGRKIR